MVIAGYNPDFAKEYGINAAILASKIEYLQAHTPREDGFCWRFQSELYDETGLTPKMQRAAAKTLVTAGLLKTKCTMIIGTAIKCGHFKLTDEYFAKYRGSYQREESVLPKGNNRKCPKVTTESAQREEPVNNIIQNNQQNSIKENAKRKTDYSELFDRFWKEYPKKVGKETARKAFARLEPTDKDVDKWITAIGIQKQSRQWRDPQYIPYPSTWLNGKRWEDVLDDAPNTGIEYEYAPDDLSFFQ